MDIILFGNGKLAKEILQNISNILHFDKNLEINKKSILIHAGSGKDLDLIISIAQKTKSIVLELSTGTDIHHKYNNKFPLIICPNTNILMLKFMEMLKNNANFFKDCTIELTESHQSEKTSVPGTAIELANSLNIKEIKSIREKLIQTENYKIKEEFLNRHAFHQIIIKDSNIEIKMETLVYGENPYSKGLEKIIKMLKENSLKNKKYEISEFIKNELL